jgi:prophage tail gpP-like protein
MSVRSYDSIGTVKDTVQLVLGNMTVSNLLSYDVACSVFSQPSAFALTFGWGDGVGELMERFPKGTPFQLRIADTAIQTGKTDAIGVQGGKSGSVVHVRGRDNMVTLFKDTFLAETAYSEATYYQLTRKMLDACGLGEAVLHADNTANRKAITGHKVVETRPVRPSDLIEVEQTATSGQRKIVYNKIKSNLGERRYDFLKRHYEKAGLFLWTAGDGSFVLSRPNGEQQAGYSVVIQRGQTRNQVNSEDSSFDDGAEERYYKYEVYGRAGSGKKGRVKCHGQWIDPEMSRLGFTETKTLLNEQCKSDKQAEYAARREGAMQIRNGWKLEHTFTGHLMPSLYDHGAHAIWAPDTVCHIVNQELRLDDDYYVSDCNFKRDMGGGTATKVKFMRRDGLVFAADDS